MRVTSGRVATAAMLMVGLAALAQAERVLRAGGLHGGAYARDPQDGDAVVLAQEPPAGTLAPPGGMVGFRTMTGVQPYGAARRLKGCGRPPPAGLTGGCGAQPDALGLNGAVNRRGVGHG